jgi:hypothetical protein
MILRYATVTSDREGIEDAVYRFVEGIDKRDADLLADPMPGRRRAWAKAS